MHHLIRFVQAHEAFRQPELEALATLSNTKVEVISYSPDSPYCIVDLQENVSKPSSRSSNELAADFISRSFLSKGIYELWAQATDYATIHEIVKSQTKHLWSQYKIVTWKFTVDAYCGKRSMTEQKEIINTFSYLGFRGKINMKTPQAHFVVFEEWEDDTVGHTKTAPDESNPIKDTPSTRTAPKQIYFCRFLGGTRRHLGDKHDLKKRPYISTTSMDALLALVTANLALSGPGKLVLDPFVGTGGFMVAASELGAITLGSDIDGRSFRGKSKGLDKGVGANFKRYGLQSLFGDCFTSDLTNTPFRLQSCNTESSHQKKQVRFLDAVISDPPYGIREGLKVLGSREIKSYPIQDSTLDSSQNQPQSSSSLPNTDTLPTRQPYLIDGVPAYLLPGYIAPKRPYSFTAMMNDILDFASKTLVDGGRLAFWMPSVDDALNDRLGDEKVAQREDTITNSVNGTNKHNSNEEDNDQQELANLKLPSHPLLVLKHVCTQSFNNWSRKLLIYERVKGNGTSPKSSIVNNLTNGSSTKTHQPNDSITTTPPSSTISTIPSSTSGLPSSTNQATERQIADDLNPFRKAYFRGFQ